MHKLTLYLIMLTLSTGLWHCASQTTPMGGPKDTIPPQLVRSKPEHKEKSYKGKSIELTFNELITLANPKDEILISPSVGKDIEFKYKKNTVTITPKDTWKDSTTYTIAIREGIKDITENNPPENLRLAFSTGPSIDSLAITGRIRLALKESVPDKITVAIYESDTFDIFEDSPTYFTIANKKGQFSLENIKSGIYHLYAFDDKNKNLKVESRTEKFGFLSEPINLTSNYDSLLVPLVALDTRKPKLNNVRNNGLYTRLVFNKYVDTYSLKFPSTDTITHSYGKDKTEIIFYNPTTIADSLQVHLTASDSVDLKIDTVFYIKSQEPNYIAEDFTIKPGKIKYSNSNSSITQTFELNKPILHINLDSIFIQTDSANFIRFLPDDFKYDSINKILSLKKHIPKDTLYRNEKFNRELKLRKAAIISIESDSSKASTSPIPQTKPDQTGTLLIETKTSEPNYIIQLTSSNNDIIEEVKNVSRHTFQFLPPQNYKIRIIVDRNGNGRWDAGNIFQNIEPEEIIFYKTADRKYEIPIRANWELGPLLLIF